MVSVNFVADRRSCVTRVDPDRSGKTRLTSSLLNLTMRPKLRILKAVWHWVPVLVTHISLSLPLTRFSHQYLRLLETELILKTLVLLGPGQLKRDVPYFWHPRNYFIYYIHLKSLVILAMWLVLSGAIYSQIALSFALNCIFFLGQWEWHRKTKQPIRFRGFFLN